MPIRFRDFQASPLLLLALLGALPCRAVADGGTVRVSERAGAYQVTVFTSPTPLRAGPVDVSVLVQDAVQQPVADAIVTVRLAPAGRAEPVIEQPATAEQATNKLMYAAKFVLPQPGRWRVVVEVDAAAGPAQVAFEMDAAEPLPRWAEMWLWIALPVAPVLLFLLHQILTRRGGRA
jgi:hypothetical protein